MASEDDEREKDSMGRDDRDTKAKAMLSISFVKPKKEIRPFKLSEDFTKFGRRKDILTLARVAGFEG